MAYQLAENNTLKVAENAHEATAEVKVIAIPNGGRPESEEKISAIAANGQGVAHSKMYG